jgi:hypothetical protein
MNAAATLKKTQEFVRAKGKGIVVWLLAGTLMAAVSQRTAASPDSFDELDDIGGGGETGEGIGGGGEIVADIEGLGLPGDLGGPRYYVIAVDAEGEVSLVEMAGVVVVPEGTATTVPTSPSGGSPTPTVQEFPNALTATPTQIVQSGTQTPPAPTFAVTATRTPTGVVTPGTPTPTLVTPAAATVTTAPDPTLAWGALPACDGYPCYHDVDRIYETTNAVWVCRNANPCGGDPENQLFLRDVGTRVAALCVIEASRGGNQWVSLTKCSAGHYGWSALKYNGRAYYKLIEDRD